MIKRTHEYFNTLLYETDNFTNATRNLFTMYNIYNPEFRYDDKLGCYRSIKQITFDDQLYDLKMSVNFINDTDFISVVSIGNFVNNKFTEVLIIGDLIYSNNTWDIKSF